MAYPVIYTGNGGSFLDTQTSANTINKGSLTFPGSLYAPGSVAANHTIYYTFNVPTSLSQVSVHLTASGFDVGSSGYESYYIGLDGTKLSGTTFGDITSSGSSAAGNRIDSVWSLSAGTHTIGVEIDGFGLTTGSPSFTLDVTSLSGGSANNTNTNPTNNIPTNNSTQPYTTSDGVTHVPAHDGNFAYTYTATDRVYLDFVQSGGGYTYTSFKPHDIINGARLSSQSTLVNNGGSISWTQQFESTPAITLKNFEGIQFWDKTIFFLDADHSNIARLYSAALGRAPDAAGLANWENNFDAFVPAAAKANYYTALSDTTLPVSGMSIAAGFTNSQEFKNKYGSLNDTQYVTQLYVNVLGRGPEAAGLNNWLNNMHDGPHLSRESVLVGLAESTENIARAAHDWLITI